MLVHSKFMLYRYTEVGVFFVNIEALTGNNNTLVKRILTI